MRLQPEENIELPVGFKKPEGNEVSVGFDAVALFPSIEKDLLVQVCREALLDIEIKFLKTNLLEVTRFLVLTMDEEEQKSCSSSGYLTWRREVYGKRTGKLGLTTANSLAPKVNGHMPCIKFTSEIGEDFPD